MLVFLWVLISNVVVWLGLRGGLVMGSVSEEVSLCFFYVPWRISKREENVGYIRRGRGRVVGFPFFSFFLHATSCLLSQFKVLVSFSLPRVSNLACNNLISR